jgi:heme/copper-type cytochrome/quinol oxidase subunit 2
MTGYDVLALLIALILAMIAIGGLIFLVKYRRKRGEPTKPDGQFRH